MRFGTDGVRGLAGEWPIDAEGARLLGLALAELTGRGRVVVGSDTRESSPWLLEAVAEGLCGGGATALVAGVLPTAAVSCAVVEERADAGVVITASHNPWPDNGLKVLASDGGKWRWPERIEAAIGSSPEPGGGTRVVLSDPAAAWRQAMPRPDLSGRRILLDCAHGAASGHASSVLLALGAEVIEVGCSPTGRNINEGVGALHPPTDLQGAELGICLDGDADRIVLVHPTAGVLDGDDILWMLCRQTDGPVVGTIMSNGGLERALPGRLVRVPVGDKYVVEGVRDHGADVGAEPSGHVIFRDGLPSGDGLYSALRVIEAAGLPLAEPGWTRLPQALCNVRSTRPLAELVTPDDARKAGLRVIVRYSGTEPLVRVMVEGESAHEWANRIAEELSA